jgi:uncharacterized protein
MLLRLALFIVLGVIVARAFWRLIDGIVDGVKGGQPRGNSRVPAHGVQMVRDPVCGTFLLPDHALTVVDGGGRVFFCSVACRDKYRPAAATHSGPARAGSASERAGGRTR